MSPSSSCPAVLSCISWRGAVIAAIVLVCLLLLWAFLGGGGGGGGGGKGQQGQQGQEAGKKEQERERERMTSSASNQGTNVLVLDLDETLVHSKELQIGTGVGYSTAERPGVREFLRGVCAAFAEVAIFTASTKEYADPILDGLEARHGVRFGRRLYRDSCTWIPESVAYAKDLRLLGVSMASVALVDNLPTSYALQPHNGVPVVTWTGDLGDAELPRLLRTLVDDLARAPDVRAAISAARFPAP